MNLTLIVVLITVYLAATLIGLYWAVATVRRYLHNAVNRMYKQRLEELRWHREWLVKQIELHETRTR